MALPTIDIKGKKYVLVSERVLYFNETYKNGSIRTELLSALDADTVVMKATVYPDVSDLNRCFTGYSQATWDDGYINKTAALENCETSAIGRALGMMGIGVVDSIASADEIHKATTAPARKPAPYSTGETAKPCSECSTACTVAETGYSTKTFGRPLCRNCQAKAKGHDVAPF